MADNDSKMVLRTVYLPPDLDEKLRVRAFRTNVTKGDLIRQGLALVFDDAEAGVASLTQSAKTQDRLHSQHVTNLVKIAGDAVSDKIKMTAEERRALVEAAERILVAAKKPVAKRSASTARKEARGTVGKTRSVDPTNQSGKARAPADGAKSASLAGS